MWEEEAPYCNFDHRTSWVQVISQDSYRNGLNNPKDRIISTQELLQMVRSQDEPRPRTDESLWLNEIVGCVYSASAIQAIAKEGSNLVVMRQTKDVTRLIVKEGFASG